MGTTVIVLMSFSCLPSIFPRTHKHLWLTCVGCILSILRLNGFTSVLFGQLNATGFLLFLLKPLRRLTSSRLHSKSHCFWPEWTPRSCPQYCFRQFRCFNDLWRSLLSKITYKWCIVWVFFRPSSGHFPFRVLRLIEYYFIFLHQNYIPGIVGRDRNSRQSWSGDKKDFHTSINMENMKKERFTDILVANQKFLRESGVAVGGF